MRTDRLPWYAISHPVRVLLLLVFLVFVVSPGIVLGEQPRTKPLTEQQKARLKERSRFYAEAQKQARAGKVAEAIGFLQKALALEREVFGNFHPTVVRSLQNIAQGQEFLGNYQEARQARQEVLAICKKLHGDRDWRVMDAGWELKTGVTRSRMSPQQKRQLDHAEALNQKGLELDSKGRFKEALPLYQQARDLRKQLLTENHPLYATSLNNLATIYQALGDYRQALPLYQQARDLRKKLLTENHPHFALSLNNLAALYQGVGNYRQALPLYQQALTLRKKLLTENHPDYASSLNNLAALYQVMGDYRKALPLYQQARDLRKKLLTEDHPDYAASLNNLALLYRDLGDYRRALPLFKQARDLTRKLLTEDHPDYADSLDNLAALYQALGDPRQALPLYQQARDLRKKLLTENHPDYAVSLDHLALLYQALGDYRQALPLFKQARDLRKKLLTENHPHYANSLNNLAALYQARGDYRQALPLFKQARDLSKKLLIENHPDYALNLSNLAGTHACLKETKQSTLFIQEALTRTKACLDDTFAVQSDRQRLEFLSQHHYRLSLFLSVSPDAGTPTGDVYNQVLSWKGVTASRQAEEQLARDQPSLRPRVEELCQVRASLARLARQHPATPEQQRGWRRRFDELEKDKEKLETVLAQKSAPYRRFQKLRDATATQLSDALPVGTAFIDFLFYDHSTPAPRIKGGLAYQRKLLAFVLMRGHKPVLASLGPAEPIIKAMRSWRRAIRTYQLPDKAGRELSRRLWHPLRKHLRKAQTVLIAPDGSLCSLPFAALPGTRPGSYLIEELAIGYVTSGRHLLELDADKDSPGGQGLLTVGDLAYGKLPGNLKTSSPFAALDYGFLPGTGVEMKRVQEIYLKAFPRGEAPQELTGKECDAPRLKKELPPSSKKAPRYLHLATHGFFEAPAPNPRRSTPFDLERSERTYARNPLLLSGLVLAGANESYERGVLTAEEVSGLDLRGVDLAVLSACETGLGKMSPGEGVLGLQRAFQMAGARTLAVSLWSVNDAATSVLMEEFYTNLWVKKMPKLKALQQAQLKVLHNPGLVARRSRELSELLVKRGVPETTLAARGILKKAGNLPDGGRIRERSHPVLWAAFVLCGDGR